MNKSKRDMTVECGQDINHGSECWQLTHCKTILYVKKMSMLRPEAVKLVEATNTDLGSLSQTA